MRDFSRREVLYSVGERSFIKVNVMLEQYFCLVIFLLLLGSTGVNLPFYLQSF
jgi:hypothetical protein